MADISLYIMYFVSFLQLETVGPEHVLGLTGRSLKGQKALSGVYYFLSSKMYPFQYIHSFYAVYLDLLMN